MPINRVTVANPYTVKDLRQRLASERRRRDDLLRGLRDAHLDPDADTEDTRSDALETVALDAVIATLEEVIDMYPATVYWCPACAEQREEATKDGDCLDCGAALASVTTDTLHALADHRDAGREARGATPDGWPPGWHRDGLQYRVPVGGERTAAAFGIMCATVLGWVTDDLRDCEEDARALAWAIHHHADPVDGQ